MLSSPSITSFLVRQHYDVYELLDLAYGRCRMVLATRAGDDPAAEALRRLGVVRVATKYPRTAARWFEETGRQAEIVEVKGSVELAPLTGLVEAIVDLTATGTTLEEYGLVVREEIATCTARNSSGSLGRGTLGGRVPSVVGAFVWNGGTAPGPFDDEQPAASVNVTARTTATPARFATLNQWLSNLAPAYAYPGNGGPITIFNQTRLQYAGFGYGPACT